MTRRHEYRIRLCPEKYLYVRSVRVSCGKGMQNTCGVYIPVSVEHPHRLKYCMIEISQTSNRRIPTSRRRVPANLAIYADQKKSLTMLPQSIFLWKMSALLLKRSLPKAHLSLHISHAHLKGLNVVRPYPSSHHTFFSRSISPENPFP